MNFFDFFAPVTSNKTDVFGEKICSYPPPLNRLVKKFLKSTKRGFLVCQSTEKYASNGTNFVLLVICAHIDPFRGFIDRTITSGLK